ncbi:unnamed protein product [Mycena citricolor]|uniref:Helitron helicase-like domain-containing protein n=1 Tax=Mycena citricolor TaxID=2018698 RepID=A0AAD2GW96_9AGAR|nr:unnamed protein product [Mycena citricolor]
MPSETDMPPEDKAAARRQRQLALERNPHLAASYLDERVQVFMKHVMGKILDIGDFWYCYEWQERGSGHVHGFLWLNDAPRPKDIDWELLKKQNTPISRDQEQKMTAFKNYWDRIVSAFNPVPRDDPNAPHLGQNPCSRSTSNIENTKQELADLLNWVQQHSKCVAGYCQVKRKVPGQQEPQTFCCFDYPMPCHPDFSTIGLDSKNRLRFEPRQNDPLLNNYNRAMLLAWRANINIKPVLSKEATINYIAKYASKSEQQAPAFPEMLDTIVKQMDGAGSAQIACQKLLNKMLATFQTLYLGEDGGMQEIIQSANEMAENLDNDKDLDGERRVTDDSWLQRYMSCPDSMGALSLYEVFSGYSWRRNQWQKRRKPNVVVRAFPRYSPNPESDVYPQYCCTKVLLHHPFQHLDKLQKRAEAEPSDNKNPAKYSWPKLGAQCRAAAHVHPTDSLRSWEEENQDQEDDEDKDEEVNADVEMLTKDDWQIFARDHPLAALPRFEASDLGTRPLDAAWNPDESRTRWNDIEQMASYLDVQRRESGPQAESVIGDIDILGAYSRILMGHQTQQILLNIDRTAGCRKTYLIHAICQQLRLAAAQNNQLDPIFHQQADCIFGGISIALVGDFAQLPPVGDRPLYAPPSRDLTDGGSLSRDGSILYRSFSESHALCVVHRQEGDSPEQEAFRALLRHASQGSLSVLEWETLLTCRFSVLCPDERATFSEALCLFTTREDVHTLNLDQLQALNEPCARMKARHNGGPAAAKVTADNAGGLEPYLTLSRRSQVIINRNLWQQHGLVNATVGTVEDVIWAQGASTSDLPEVVLVSCKDYTGPTLWRTEPQLPDFPGGVPIVPIPTVKSTFNVGDKQMSRVQVPLRLAWAVTIHKSQGLTIPKIKLGLGKKGFAMGLTFVGLSRVKALADIAILGQLDYSRVHNLGGKNMQYRTLRSGLEVALTVVVNYFKLYEIWKATLEEPSGQASAGPASGGIRGEDQCPTGKRGGADERKASGTSLYGSRPHPRGEGRSRGGGTACGDSREMARGRRKRADVGMDGDEDRRRRRRLGDQQVYISKAKLKYIK